MSIIGRRLFLINVFVLATKYEPTKWNKMELIILNSHIFFYTYLKIKKPPIKQNKNLKQIRLCACNMFFMVYGQLNFLIITPSPNFRSASLKFSLMYRTVCPIILSSSISSAATDSQTNGVNKTGNVLGICRSYCIYNFTVFVL